MTQSLITVVVKQVTVTITARKSEAVEPKISWVARQDINTPGVPPFIASAGTGK